MFYYLGIPILFGSVFAVTPDPSLATSVVLNGQTFINKGLVAFGYVPAQARDSFGETLGSLRQSLV